MTRRAPQQHVTVLLKEAVDALNVKRDSIVVDATLGSGGHTKEILSRLSSKGICISIDADPKSIESFKSYKGEMKVSGPKLVLENDNFKNLTTILERNNIETVDSILADLGWRTEQFSEGERGFSFLLDEPLLMTYGNPKEYPFTATNIVNEWDEEVIANILYGYGEERYARRIAKIIVEKRKVIPITTSTILADIVSESVPISYKHKKLHPATKTFQALRIAVNDELNTLQTFIYDSAKILNKDGHLVIITFHSIEDRMVKQTFKELEHNQIGEVLTKKPKTPTREEIKTNPRARSAKIRILKKTI